MSFVFFKNKIIYFGLGSLSISSCAEYTDANVSDLNLAQRYVSIDETLQAKGIEESYEKGKVLLFDNKDKINSDFSKKIMSKASGLSINSDSIILLKKSETGPLFRLLSKDMNEFEIKEQIIIFQNMHTKIKSSAPAHNLLNKSSVNITVLKRNISCPMNMFKGKKNGIYIKDFCEGKAFVELNYKIDMYGSVSLGKTDEKKDEKTDENINSHFKATEGKYIVVTVSPYEEGGSGWHISEDLKQKHLLDPSWRYRHDYVGPFANKYKFWVQSDSKNENLKLVNVFPKNDNIEMEVSGKKGITYGMKGGLKLGIDKAFTPTSVLDLEGTRQVSLSHEFSYMSHEFKVKNQSSYGRAQWTWDAEMNNSKVCEALTGEKHGHCEVTRSHYKPNWVIALDTLKRSAISYSSFTPSFQAIYKTSKDNVGKSTFTVGTSAEIGTILGKVRPSKFNAFRDVYSASYESFTTPDITKSFTVDWSSPFFEPEQNVRLQNMNSIKSTKCLSVNKRNMIINGDNTPNIPVTLEPCQDERAQIWGYDNEEKVFKSRADKNLCLTLVDSSLIVSACAYDNTQKWILNSDGNIQSHVDKKKLIGINSDGNLEIVNEQSKGKIKFEAFNARL